MRPLYPEAAQGAIKQQGMHKTYRMYQPTWMVKAAGMPAMAPWAGQKPVSLLQAALADPSSTTT